MSVIQPVSRRSFLTAAGLGALGAAALGAKKIPVGIELYSVRTEMAKDPFPPVTEVARQGYEVVEFYGPYFDWSEAQCQQMRKQMDDLKIVCRSTHNGNTNFTPGNIQKAIDLNKILGSTYIVMASAGRVDGLDGWKKVAETLSFAAEKAQAAGLKIGYHNHATEFRLVEGSKPLEIIAKNTPKNVMLQLDVGTAVEAGSDPVAWIKANPGRINCVHCKDWSKDPAKGFKVLFGEGDSPWKEVFAAAESVGGVEYYLIEQEGYHLPPYETAEKCLANFKKIHG